MGEPHVPADDAVVPNARFAAENCGIGVHRDVVFQVRVALVLPPSAQLALRILAERIESAQRDPVVERHLVADGRSFPNDDAGPVVYEE